jgi:hypothetical protein
LRLITALLILIIVLGGASFPSALSQAFTTVTNTLTTTNVITSNAYSTNTIGTVTQTVLTMNTFVSTEDTIQKPAGSSGCYYGWWNITVDPGTTEVTGTIGPPSSQIDFYIMNPQQYVLFSHESCDQGPYDAQVASYGLTSTYSLDWKNPAPGWYAFVFSTTSIGAAGFTITTPFTLVASFNQAETSTEYNVFTNQVTLQNTQTLTSVQVSQVSGLLSSPIGPTTLVIAVVVVVAVVAALFFVRSRQGKQTKTKIGGQTFCINCGKELPLGSKFCNKCGSSQE